MTSVAVSPVFVGRDVELRALHEAFARAGAGSPATVLIGGEAGVGKSRLVTEFTAGLAGRAQVLVGGCLELGETGLAFAPFTAVLRGLVRELGADELVRLLPRGAAGELSRLLPALGSPDGTGDADLARARLFEQFLALVAGLAERRPVVLIVEDVHWADRSSRDLLSFLVGNQQAAPALLVVATHRSEGLKAAHPVRQLLAELDRMEWVQRLQLGRLARSGVAVQLRGLLGREPETELIETIYRRSEGNPLFVEALLSCAGRPGPRLPQSIRDLLVAPLELLPEPTQEAVRAAAPGGIRVGHALLAAVTRGDAELSRALRPAVAANLMVVDEDAYVFRHGLIRDVVHEELLPGERAALHVRYAEALEADPSLAPPGRAAAELAHHWYEVAGQHAARALAAAWHAAGDAKRSLAYAEQQQMLTHVLELWARVPDSAGQLGTDRVAVLEEAIQAAAAAGEGDRAMTLITTALAEIDPGDDPARAARVLRHRGELRTALVLPGQLEDLQEAARLMPVGHPARASILNTLADRLLTIPRDEAGLAAAEEAVAAARAVGDAQSEVMAAITVAYARARAGDLDEQLPHLAAARAAAERLDDHRALMHVCRCESDLLEGEGRHEQAAEAARRGLGAAALAGLSRTAGPVHAGNLAEALISIGRWDQATEILEHAVELNPTPNLRGYLLVLRGWLALARDDLAVAETAADYAREVFTSGSRDVRDFLLLLGLEIDLRRAQGRQDAAVGLVEHIPATTEAKASPRYLWPVIAAGAGAMTAESGRALAGLRALAAEVPVIGPFQRAHQLTYAAETARLRDPTDWAPWDRAAQAWAELRQPYPRARALLRAAEAATEAGERDAATGRLRIVAEHADRLGAPALRVRVAALAKLTRTSLTADQEGVAGSGAGDDPGEQSRRRLGLTPRELEVLRLVAEGRTNRQIAEELFISIKTASVHVSNILGKLGVAGRVQAATIAHRLRLL